MRMTTSRLSLLLSTSIGTAAALFLTLSPRQAGAVGEQNARLRGQIVEAGTNVPMPGAKVTITSDDLIGGPRTASTDEEGNFDFPRIPHGTYVVTVTYEGLKPIKRRVRLDLGETETLKIPFAAEMANVETTTIVEERKRIDTDKVSTGRVLTAEQQGKIATGRSYQSVVSQLPGVVGTGNPIMAGGSFRHNRYLVDGLDITDPVTNTFSSNFNFDAIAQIDTVLIAVDAQYNSLGGVINLVTKRGSDKFHVDASFYFNHQALSAGGRAGTQLYEGRLLDQTDPRPPTAGYQANINLSGPIIKQKLWFYLSTEFRYTLNSVVPGPPLNSQHISREFYGIYPRLKLTWAPAKRHRIELSLNSDPAFIYNQVQANTAANEIEYNQRQGGAFGILNWDYFATDNLIVGVQTGVAFNQLLISPANGDTINQQHQDRASTINWNAGGAYRTQNDQRWRFQFDPTFTWLKKGWGGSHTFKGGAQFQYTRRYQELSTPGNGIYTDDTNQTADAGVLVRNPTGTDRPYGCNELQPRPVNGQMATPCFRLNQYEPNLARVQQGVGIGFYLQDTWKPTTWLTIAPGFRIDYGRAQNSLGDIVQNMLGFGPRLGVNIDLTRDNKTILKAAYGRANETLSLLTSSSADYIPQVSTWNYNRTSGRFDSFYTSSGGKDGFDLRGRCTDGANIGQILKECGNERLSLTPPRADFVTVSLERELFANVIGSITYSFRDLRFMWEDFAVNSRATLDGGNYAAFGDQRYGDIYAYRPSKESGRTYHGVDFAIAGSPSPNWNFFVAYTLSFLYGASDDQSGPLRDDPPRDFRYYGFLPDDHRHQLKANGSYTWRGLTLGLNFAYLTGAPTDTRLYLVPNGYVGRYAWRGIDPGADPNDIRKWTELRSPDLVDINLRAQFDFHALIKQHLSIIVDLFNALDLSNATGGSSLAGFENRNATTYGQVTGRQTPFRAQFALRFQY